MNSKCEECIFFDYDDVYDYSFCSMNLDEDETYKFVSGNFSDCPYFRPGDDYTIVRRQN